MVNSLSTSGSRIELVGHNGEIRLILAASRMELSRVRVLRSAHVHIDGYISRTEIGVLLSTARIFMIDIRSSLINVWII